MSKTGAKPRRPRDPDGTRKAILKAAQQLLAQYGKEGVSVARVAERAGVHRGTAYQHFRTREQLIDATVASVGEQLYRAVLGNPSLTGEQLVESGIIERVTEHVAAFAMENPEIGRIWLFEVLSSPRPANDRFWQQYASNLEHFVKTEFAQAGVDAEVVSVLTLAGTFLWPVWAHAQTRTTTQRQEMAKRFSRELLRLCLHGNLRPEKYPDLNAYVSSPPTC
jgi:AcrR family transcriptional regulator